ncbi:hypothetical protein D0817_03670 [Flavobacterium cupreum]|uniref:Thioredoxin domain-containing protein n=1 Tax=Flavobacterium cupreum TaxID=2133766 RepID=A0A434ABP6_9FLAO|nr:thioredoxin family protein [Flavobacterium cupreum]RUT71795.1 hypothetical protein D0817_03670 [Flavobacterium cupreum]
MRTGILICCLIITFFSAAQEKCNLSFSKKEKIYAIDIKDIKCIAENSDKKNTLFFTFGVWCKPCRLHLPNAIQFSTENNVNFYVLLVEAEENEKTKEAIDYLKAIKDDIKIVILKDESYGVKRSEKNKKFVKEITPKEFENVDDYSKYILLNNKGEVVIVTNWKDNNGNDWRDDSEMIRKRILPLL